MTSTRFPNGVTIGNQAGSTATFTLGSTDVVSTAAELNTLHGVPTTAHVLTGIATGAVIATGSTLLTAGGSITSGLGGQVTRVIAGISSGLGTGCFQVSGYPVGAVGGSIGFSIANSSGAAATTAGTISWIAVGTA